MVQVDIISGFLGAGKTTLISKLLKTVYAGENVVLIENEYGEIGIDGGFLKEAGIEIKEMNSGCICCSLVGDFSESLKEVVKTYNPSRIIIEPSGVGKLSDVVKAVEGMAGELDMEVAYKAVVVDVTKARMYVKNFGEFYLNQIENAETVFLSRTDVTSIRKAQEALAIIKEHNDRAAVVTTPVEQLDTEAIRSALMNNNGVSDMLEEEEHEHFHHHNEEECSHGHHHDEEECCHGHHHDEEECCHGHHHDEEECCHGHHHDDEECCHGHHHNEEECSHEHHHHNEDEHHHHGEACSCGHDHEHHHHHHADDVFTSWGTETPEAFTEDKLKALFDKFERETKGAILRSKGIVKAEEKDEWIYFDYVPGQFDLRYGAPDYIGKVCVIASGYTEDELKEIFFG